MTAATINRWLAALRIMHPTAFLVRGTVLLSGIAVLTLLGTRPWNVADLVWVTALPLLLACTVLPDSAASVCFIGIIGADWVIQSDGRPGVPIVVCALLLVVLHLASAYAGQVPSYAASSPAAVRKWLLPATVASAAAALAAVLSAAVDGRPGSLVLTCVALVAVALLSWFLGAA